MARSPVGRRTLLPGAACQTWAMDPSLEPTESEQTIGSRDLTRWHTAAGRWLSRMFGELADRLRNVEAAALLLLALAALLAVGATVLAGEIYESIVETSGIARFDQPVLDWMISIRTPERNAIVTLFSASGGPFWMSILTSVAVTALCLIWHRWTPLVLTVIAVSGALSMTIAGKRLSGRARPPLEDSLPPPETSASFPSGHALNSLVIGGTLCYLLVSHLTSTLARAVTVTLTLLYVIAMGMSRVYLGHHWLTDVLAAWCLGIAWLTVVITSHRLWLTQHTEHRLGPREPLASPA